MKWHCDWAWVYWYAEQQLVIFTDLLEGCHCCNGALVLIQSLSAWLIVNSSLHVQGFPLGPVMIEISAWQFYLLHDSAFELTSGSIYMIQHLTTTLYIYYNAKQSMHVIVYMYLATSVFPTLLLLRIYIISSTMYNAFISLV